MKVNSRNVKNYDESKNIFYKSIAAFFFFFFLVRLKRKMEEMKTLRVAG